MTINDKMQAYCEAVSTQDSQLFESLWSKEAECTLVSIGKIFKGYSSIYNDFLIGGIRASYEKIALIPENISIAYSDDTTIIVTFRYHTECIRRIDGSSYGISGVETQVWRLEDDWRMIYLHYSKV